MEHKKLISAVIKVTLEHTTLHYTTLHYTTLHYTTLHYTTLFSLSPSSYALQTVKIFELNVTTDRQAVTLERVLRRQVHTY